MGRYLLSAATCAKLSATIEFEHYESEWTEPSVENGFLATEKETAQNEPMIAADIVSRIASGDRSAEDDLYRRYARGLIFVIKRQTADDALAEDICHNTFVTAIEKLRSEDIKEPERLAGFLRGIAMNKLAGDWRKRARRGTTSDSEAIERAMDERRGPLDELSAEQTQKAVRALLEELNQPRDRDILISVFLRDEDKQAICRRLEIDAAHFNRVLFRAKKRFGEILERARREGRLRLVD